MAVEGTLEGQDFIGRARAMLLDEHTGPAAVVAIDIDHLNLYNDVYGTEAGDLFVAEVSKIVGEQARKHGGVGGHIGSDNFCVVAPLSTTETSKISALIDATIREHHLDTGFSVSVGVCVTDGRPSDFGRAYDRALLALSSLVGNHQDHVCVYDTQGYEEMRQDELTVTEAREGLRNGEFTFYLQPKVDIATGKIVSSEALVRWMRKGEIIAPARFVDKMENNGYIFALDRYVWDQVCAWQRSLIDRGIDPLPCSINVSRIDFMFADVAAHFQELVAQYDLEPSYIEIEITESTYAENEDMMREQVERLHEAGFIVLMDDFGSGYSSLNMLRSVNVDVLKIDRAFLEEPFGKRSQHIVESLMAMAHMLDLPVEAEGVETSEQLQVLAELGCPVVQGFYHFRPMPKESFERLLEATSGIDHLFLKENYHVSTLDDEVAPPLSVIPAAVHDIPAPLVQCRITDREEGIVSLRVLRANRAFEAAFGRLGKASVGEPLGAFVKGEGRDLGDAAREAASTGASVYGAATSVVANENINYVVGPASTAGYVIFVMVPRRSERTDVAEKVAEGAGRAGASETRRGLASGGQDAPLGSQDGNISS